MTPAHHSEDRWTQLSELIAERIGLHFPRERRDDLQRGIASAAREFGFDEAQACVDWLLSEPLAQSRFDVLASHLTIGETYFFRDTPTMRALQRDILPALIGERRGRAQRLRLWSAACATGEEPYTLAILLHELLPDLKRWHVTITATDINAQFLRKAAAGVYGEWSFRGAPAGLKERFFEPAAKERYVLRPEIKALVKFEHLNLVQDVYPSLATDTNAMDLILCRNALMYFTPPQMSKVIGTLHQALVEGGWLVVSPSETSQSLFPQFVAVNFPGAIVYRKSAGAQSELRGRATSPTDTVPPTPAAGERPAGSPAPASASRNEVPRDTPTEAPRDETTAELQVAESLYAQGRYAQAAEMLLAAFEKRAPDAAAFSLLARALANQGRLPEALAWCERWIAADKMDAAGHYLRAVILMEQGDATHARSSLQRAIYLAPEFVLAHFAWGNLARAGAKTHEARRHFANALRLLRAYEPADVLPAAEGLTAGRLTETLLSLTAEDDLR